MINFQELFQKTRGNLQVPERLLCLDPGETTGWALFEESSLVRWGQIVTVQKEQLKWNNLGNLFVEQKPTAVVCENYRIYDHKLARHTFSPVLTLRLIGGIDCLCRFGWYENLGPHYIDEYGGYRDYYEQHTCPIYYQMATQAKGFVTDDKLKQWGFYDSSMRHARDAIRHGCYFLLFHNRGRDIDG